MPIEPEGVPGMRLPFEAMDLEGEVVFDGGDLTASWLLAGYRAGIFPMPQTCPPPKGCSHLYWYSPTERGLIPIEGWRPSRSLAKRMRRWETRIDTAFEEVLVGCARFDQEDGKWLTPQFADAYRELHRLGWAHSIEAWTSDGELAGGVLGVEVGGLFAGDTMVTFQRDGSKAALAGLIGLLADGGPGRILDTQWLTPHLASLGGIEVARREYHRLLTPALTLPPLLSPQPTPGVGGG